MTQGTMSVLLGCHSVYHSWLVVRAWRILFGRYPRAWELICILLHDVGHAGKQYLDDLEAKEDHWRLGAHLACRLFGRRGYRLVAGHCADTGVARSPLYKADKYAWYIAPTWWLFSNTVFEPKLRMGYSRMGAVERFKKSVKRSIESGEFRPTHQFYLDRCSSGETRRDVR